MNTVTTQTPTLQIGSQGGAVKTLQQLLNQRVSRDYSVSVDGIFGAKTQAAVEIFQYSKLRRRDGIVGARTWQALQSNRRCQRFVGTAVEKLWGLLKTCSK